MHRNKAPPILPDLAVHHDSARQAGQARDGPKKAGLACARGANQCGDALWGNGQANLEAKAAEEAVKLGLNPMFAVYAAHGTVFRERRSVRNMVSSTIKLNRRRPAASLCASPN